MESSISQKWPYYKNKIIEELESNVILSNKLTSALGNAEKHRKKFTMGKVKHSP